MAVNKLNGCTKVDLAFHWDSQHILSLVNEYVSENFFASVHVHVHVCTLRSVNQIRKHYFNVLTIFILICTLFQFICFHLLGILTILTQKLKTHSSHSPRKTETENHGHLHLSKFKYSTVWHTTKLQTHKKL